MICIIVRVRDIRLKVDSCQRKTQESGRGVGDIRLGEGATKHKTQESGRYLRDIRLEGKELSDIRPRRVAVMQGT